MDCCMYGLTMYELPYCIMRLSLLDKEGEDKHDHHQGHARTEQKVGDMV